MSNADPDIGNEEAVTSALETLGSDIKGVGRGYVHASCPLAKWRHEGGVDNNPSFGVVYSSAEAKKEEGHAHCFSCGYSGDIREIATLMHVWSALPIEKLSEIMETMEKVKTGNLPLSLSTHVADDPFPDQDWIESFPLASEHQASVDYLHERGISDAARDFFKLRFDPQRYRVVCTLTDRQQRSRGLIGRTLIKNPMGPRYYYYPFKKQAPRGFTWFNEHTLDLSKPVLVVEGYFDALKIWPVYSNVTAALSVSFRSPEWTRTVGRWVSMFDIGKGGNLGRTRLQEKVAQKGSHVYHLMPPDGRDDPADSTEEELRSRIMELNG